MLAFVVTCYIIKKQSQLQYNACAFVSLVCLRTSGLRDCPNVVSNKALCFSFYRPFLSLITVSLRPADPQGHDIKLNTFKTSVALKFMIVLQNLTTTNRGNNGRVEYERKLTKTRCRDWANQVPPKRGLRPCQTTKK